MSSSHPSPSFRSTPQPHPHTQQVQQEASSASPHHPHSSHPRAASHSSSSSSAASSYNPPREGEGPAKTAGSSHRSHTHPHSHSRARSDSQASNNSSSVLSSSGFGSSGQDSRTTFSRTTATEEEPSLRASIVRQSSNSSHLQQQQQLFTAISGGTQPLTILPAFQHQLQQLQHMPSSSPFSNKSGQRHTSLGGSVRTMMSPVSHHSSPMIGSNAAMQQQSGGDGGQQFYGAGINQLVDTPFRPDNNLRPAYLDESGLSPDEFAYYLPALLRLKEAPSGVDGLYDEQDALKYLREECGIELRDEAMIMALFERTPLGIRPGHFFAWLRLASWAQQGQMPTKTHLFTQTVPARTHSMRKASGRQTARPAAVSSMPPPPTISISNSLGDIRREASFASPTSPPASAPPYQMQQQHQQQQQQRHRSMASPPPAAQHGMAKLPAPIASASRQGQHGRINSIGSASALGALPPTPGAAVPGAKPMPPLPQGVDGNGGRSTSNPFRDQPSAQPAQPRSQKGAPAPGEHPPYVVPPTQSFILQHAAPALPTPPAPRPPPPGKLPLDALLGFDPAPNPFKQNKPRIVRPTPVVASAAAPVPNPFRTPVPRDREATGRAESVVSLGDERGGSQYGGETSHGGLARSIAANDRLPPPLPPRAGVSPLIQAGLNAASEVQRAKQALPPKTYISIQRSATSASKPTRREPRLLTGQVAPPEVVAPLAQRAAEREAELYGGNPPARRKSSVGTSVLGQQRRSVSEAATMIRRASEEEDVKNRGGHGRASSSVTARSNVYSPDHYSRGGEVTSKKLSRLQDDEDQHVPRPASNRPGITGVPSWLQEQEEIQRTTGRDNSLPSPIPEDIQLELDSPADEMSENAMSAASIERPGNPFTQRSEQPPPPPIMKDRPLGRSKTLSSKNPPPAPPRKRNESFPANVSASSHKATFKKEVADHQQQQSSNHLRIISPNHKSPERPSPIEEESPVDKSGLTSGSSSIVSPSDLAPSTLTASTLRPKSAAGAPQSNGTREDKNAKRSLLQNADDDEDEDEEDDAGNAFHDASAGNGGDGQAGKASIEGTAGNDRNGYARLD